MNIEIGQKVLITTNEWFFGGDGRLYRSAWGTVKSVRTSEVTLGVRTNARSTNWYVELGSMIIAGCQIHYLVGADAPPPDTVEDHSITEGVVRHFVRPSQCWNADAAMESRA
ncbi:hypothetical protein [Stenotrophomonas lactitubi]|uniref:hypothetical protein n=1 Tax=Stenotrophomonas lactitubi TaxID=2045214 RepID=UPI001DF8ADDC|nr:hypothetical protein [Stenotrophomonas lactitubi]CAH0174545.1 hypothetical protein SRABI81_01307 [Stenotrophomonas lactitubi]CAH0174868.1 hypothetical protein SRABI122_01275 [Stenotrophomonas lactitubi]CAH0193028.1 hypothetical protein SRABI102_01564 [Stenotrophomonas lactitubi]CAH0227511.1 hypothetical protein SRABI66_02603 [Stenotrophomonas lactitubi]